MNKGLPHPHLLVTIQASRIDVSLETDRQHLGNIILAAMISVVNALPKDSKALERRDTTRFVFAHFMVGIVSNRKSAADWDADMIRAKAYGIDAFALNIGTDSFTDQQLGYAYTSAQNNGMKVFISFDFNFWSIGSGTSVGQKVAQYASLPAQLLVDSKPFVSSFIGDGVDVAAIRNAAGTPIYFAPNFHPSQGTSLSSVDAAFNWMGWPNNGNNRAPNPGQTGTVEAGDSTYISALNGKDYLAPASPWFFTHYGSEVSYSKNWLFPGDQLWFQRWTDLLTLGPRFIEIVSWNDYGESHYVGPLSSPHNDDGASKWVNDMPHDGWLDMAKPFIAAFKAGATTVDKYITSDQLIYWYRPQSMQQNCDATDTCMKPLSNSDYYIGPPNGWQTVSDRVFVVSLLKSAGTLQISSGTTVQTFNTSAGANIFSIPMGVGQQKFSLTRNSQTVLSGTSLKDIINGCVCGLYNFNAYVGTLPGGFSDPLGSDGFGAFTKGLVVTTCAATPSLGTAALSSPSTSTSTATISNSTGQKTTTTATSNPSSTLKSISTTEPNTTTSMTPITTTATTTLKTTPTSTSTSKTSTTTKSISSTTTSPAKSSSITSTTSTTTKSTTITTTNTSTTPKSTSPSASTSTSIATVCTSGTGPANYAGLCSFSCHYGYCPVQCTCSSYGAQIPPPPSTGAVGVPAPGLDASYKGLCSFSCDHGYCPSTACVS